MYPILAVALVSMEHMLCKGNYTSVWNGYGAIDYVIARTAKSPARQRVLVPWLVWATEWLLGGKDDPPERLPIYLFWKWALMSAALMVAGHFFSHAVALGMALYWALTFQYDYWSVYGECLAFLLALTGNVWLACAGALVGVASKPTFILLPFVFLFSGGGWWTFLVGAVCIIGKLGIYWYQGQGEGSKFRKPMNVSPHYIFAHYKDKIRWYVMGWAVIAVSLVALAHWQYMPSPFRETAWVLPVVCGMGFFGAMVYEPRVFALNALWIASLLV